MPFRRIFAVVAACALAASACGADPSVATPGSTGEAPSATTSSPSTAVGPPACPTAAPAIVDDAPWWRDRVIYEVFVRSFADSDGDGIGDLRGLTDRLDALNDGDPATTHDLGVSALWLMPVAASPSYHGYDVTDHLTVEPDYGTNDDLRALVAAAHERGIAVIVDLVLNHTSVEHPWFQAARTPGSAKDGWYVWADAHPGIAGPGGRPVWHPDGQRWYYGYFWEGMPDLDVADAEVTAALDAIAAAWLTDFGVDGFRLDAARHLIEDGSTLENTPATFDWLQGFGSRLRAVDPDPLLLGEVWDSTSVASRYVREGALDLAFEFGLASQWLLAMRSGDATSLRTTQAEVTAAYPPGGYASFLTNHDQDRVFDVVARDPGKAAQAATLLLTSAGVPVIYYGEEIGLRGRKPDERIRTPLPWTTEAPGHGFTTAGEPWQPFADGVAEGTAVAPQVADPTSLWSHYRDLIRLRAAHPALRGDAPIVDVGASDPAIYATLRHDAGGDAVVVVSNLGEDAVDDVVLSLPAGPLCGQPTARVVFGTPSTPVGDPVVGPMGGLDAWPIGRLAGHQDLVIALAATPISP